MRTPTIPIGPMVSEKKIKKDNIIFYTIVSLVVYVLPIGKNNNIFKDHIMNIPTKLGSNSPSGFREDLKTDNTLFNTFGPSNEYSCQFGFNEED
jgi:hypothetical protein